LQGDKSSKAGAGEEVEIYSRPLGGGVNWEFC
jgi:hypothetical protein